jgi:hypothetical protein
MENHVHLLVKAGKTSLPAIMKRLELSCSHYFCSIAQLRTKGIICPTDLKIDLHRQEYHPESQGIDRKPMFHST